MPRITAKACEYKNKDFCKWVEGERAVRKATQADFGQIIGISRISYAAKIEKGQFTFLEVLKFIEYLKPSDDVKLLLLKV